MKCSSRRQGGPGLAAETWNSGVTSVLSLGPHPEPGGSWDAEVLGRDQTHTQSFIALRPQEEAMDIISGLQAQGFLVAEDTMG